VYYDYQAGANRNVPGGRLSLFAFGSNDSLKVITTDPRQGNIDLGLELGFHKLFAIWTEALRNWTNKLTPSVGYERLRFGAGSAAINQSAYILALRDELTRPLGKHLNVRIGFDGEQRFSSLFFNLPVPPDSRLYGETIPMPQQRTIPLDTAAGGL